MLESLVAANLINARKRKGLTQVEVAKRANLSVNGYSKLEHGKSEPRPDTLKAVAVALDTPIRELLRPVEKVGRVRFRANKQLRLRRQIVADVAHWLADYRSLEAILGEESEYQLKSVPAAVSKRSKSRPALAASLVRQELGLGREPIRDICGLLESTGIKMWHMSIDSPGFFGLSVAEGQGPAIVVNTSEKISVERWIFTAVHELGHLLLHLSAYVDEVPDKIEPEIKKEEDEANQFASRLLMPDELFDAEWEETRGLDFVDRVLKVKRMFRVSYKTVLHRVGERHGNQVYPVFNAGYKRRYGVLRKHEEPEGLSSVDFKEERLNALARSAVERELISLGRAAEILRLPLAEMRIIAKDWSR